MAIPTVSYSSLGTPRLAHREPVYSQIPQESFWLAPIAFGGYLWALSEAGNLYRISPATGHCKPIEDMKGEYGRYPFGFVREEDNGRDLLAIVGTRRLALLDPAVHKLEDDFVHPEERRGLPRAANFVAVDDCFSAVAGLKGEFASLIRTREGPRVDARTPREEFKRGTLGLGLWRRGESVRYLLAKELESAKGSGPLILGNRFAFYTDEELFWLEGSELKRQSFPRRFLATTHSTDSLLQLPRGRAPFIKLSQGAYIPGEMDGSPAMVFAEFHGNGPAFSIKRLDNGCRCTYTLGDNDNLMVISTGKMLQLSHATLSTVGAVQDEQLIPEPAVTTGEVYAAVCRTSVGGREVRLYPWAHQRIHLEDRMLLLDLFFFPGHLVMSYLNMQKADCLEVVAWPLE